MFCRSCGKQLSDGAQFCHSCGAPVAGAAASQRKEGIKPGSVVLIILLVFVLIAAACGVGYIAAQRIAASQQSGTPILWLTQPSGNKATHPTTDATTAPWVNSYLEHSSPILAESSQRYLTADDLEPLSSTELVLARHEILARHGVIFSDEALSAYFDAQDWYESAVPEAEFDQTTLSDQESVNIQLIGLYEKIASGGYAPTADNPYMAYYDPAAERLLPQSSNTRLTEADLMGFNADQLLLIRNQIIALHGYAFEDQHLMEYFLQCSWYRPSTPPGRTDLVKGMTGLEYDNMSFLFQYEQQPQTPVVNPAILGVWCSGYGKYTEDGLFQMCYGDVWYFNADGTFSCSESESIFFYNPDGTDHSVLGAGGLAAKGMFSFDGAYLTVTTTHRYESSSGPYIELTPPAVSYATITLEGDTLLVNWGNRVERFYRETGDALLQRLMKENAPQ